MLGVCVCAYLTGVNQALNEGISGVGRDQFDKIGTLCNQHANVTKTAAGYSASHFPLFCLYGSFVSF